MLSEYNVRRGRFITSKQNVEYEITAKHLYASVKNSVNIALSIYGNISFCSYFKGSSRKDITISLWHTILYVKQYRAYEQ